MSFLSWCRVCENPVLIFTSFFSGIASLLFFGLGVHFSIKCIEKITKKHNKILPMWMLIVFGFILFFIIMLLLQPIFNYISKIITDKYFVVSESIKDGIVWGEDVTTYEQLVLFSNQYISMWLYGISIFSYIYCLIVRKISKKNNFIKYIILLGIVIVLVFFFINSYEYLIANIDSFYKCHTDCG